MGSGSETMRPAVCFFVKKLAIARIFQLEGFKLEEAFLIDCETFLKQCIEQVKESVQMAAAETIPFYCDLRYAFKAESADKLIETFLHNLKSTRKEYVRSGYCLAVGFFPEYLLTSNGNFNRIVRALIEASKSFSGQTVEPTKPAVSGSVKSNLQDSGWVTARKDAIKGLTNLFKLIKKQTDIHSFDLNTEIFLEVIDAYFYGLNDYSIDAKGDSGSKVREAAIEGLESFIELCARYQIADIITNKELITNCLGKIVQQSTERIDRTRNLAGRAFGNLIHNQFLNLNFLPFIVEIRSVFKKSMCEMLDWNVAHITFPLFVKLMRIKEFQTHLLTGIIFSIGSLTESLVKSATSSFLKELKEFYLNKEKKEDFKEIIEIILTLCQHHLTNDRLSTSLIKSVDLIIQNEFLNDDFIRNEHLPHRFLVVFIENAKVTKDMQKLLAYIDLFADMLQFDEERIRERAMIQLMIMLCHPYPRIRKTCASKLFEALLNYGEMFESEQDNDECTQLLTDTNWDQAIDVIRPIRNRLCDLTKTPKPVMSKQAATTTAPTPTTASIKA